MLNLLLCSIALKENLEKRLDSWQEETDQLTSLFRELAKCKRKDLLKENDKLATKVATVEKEFLKRVNSAVHVHVIEKTV